jgi:hypothetical protein
MFSKMSSDSKDTKHDLQQFLLLLSNQLPPSLFNAHVVQSFDDQQTGPDIIKRHLTADYYYAFHKE